MNSINRKKIGSKERCIDLANNQFIEGITLEVSENSELVSKVAIGPTERARSQYPQPGQKIEDM